MLIALLLAYMVVSALGMGVSLNHRLTGLAAVGFMTALGSLVDMGIAFWGDGFYELQKHLFIAN